MNVIVPKQIRIDEYPYYRDKPCWIPVQDANGKKLKPLIVCQCGARSGIGLHHVHADGRVTASFYHLNEGGAHANDGNGCGWHVFITLEDYDEGDFPPEK